MVVRILPKSGSFKWPSLISLIRLFFAKRETTLIVPINCQYLASYSYPGANPICQGTFMIFFFVGNLSRFNLERLSPQNPEPFTVSGHWRGFRPLTVLKVYRLHIFFNSIKSERFGSSAFFVASINGISLVVRVHCLPVAGLV